MISIALEWFRTLKPISGLDWIGLDWIGWYPGGRGYRAPYGANNRITITFKHDDHYVQQKSILAVSNSFNQCQFLAPKVQNGDL